MGNLESQAVAVLNTQKTWRGTGSEGWGRLPPLDPRPRFLQGCIAVLQLDTERDMSTVMQGVGGTQESIREVLEEVDKDGDGRIDYDEFCVMMRGSEAPATNAKQKGAQGGPVGGGS